MRTLKFRYWNTITKEMVNNPKMPYKENWTIEQLFEDRGWVWMQFTGLTDRHGTEIYEGDIVHIQHPYDYIDIRGTRLGGDFFDTTGLVFWWDEEGGWYHGHVSTKNGNGRPPKRMWKHCEIIGNVYENPELLEEGK